MKVEYPNFDGSQPCAQVDLEFYYSEPRNIEERNEIKTIKSMCFTCDFREECLEWAIHYERYGLWGGTNEDERKVIRKNRGIIVTDPAYLL